MRGLLQGQRQRQSDRRGSQRNRLHARVGKKPETSTRKKIKDYIDHLETKLEIEKKSFCLLELARTSEVRIGEQRVMSKYNRRLG